MKVQVLLLLISHASVLIWAAAIQENGIDDVDVGENGEIDAKKCPPWDKWQPSKCLWPTQQLSSLPKACTSLPKKPEIPAILKQFVQSKQIEIYSVIQNLFKLRGAKAACGRCSRKIRCRQRKGGEWKAGCKFIQAQMVDEECDGNKPCEITPVLGACPPPVPMPVIRRRPKPHEPESIDLNEKLQRIGPDVLGDEDLEIEAGKNSSQGPPLWHCVRNNDGSKCLCCCGWYLPDAKSGKCVKIRKDETEEDDHIWKWSGLTDFDLQHPYTMDVAVSDSMIEQIEAPPMEMAPDGTDEADREPGDDGLPMPNPPAMEPSATDHQVVAPVTDTVLDKIEKKKVWHEENEI